MTEQLDNNGRWWRVGAYEVDLNATAGTYPPNVRAAALAERDGEDDESADVAALSEAVVSGAIPEHTSTDRMVTRWLFEQSQRIAGRSDDEHAA